MRIDIRTNGFPLTEAIREYAARRLRYALTRADEHVRWVALHLGDVNGPRGGRDKRCRVRVMLKGRPDVVIDDVETDLYAAIDRAANRAGRSVARCMSRQVNFTETEVHEPAFPPSPEHASLPGSHYLKGE
ncbi:MAG: 30S ribosomal protein S30 [Betaproteobacteria bacterium HGW-Betaproteobacteria-14]|nr:MAG: 30S ribosomal protein S30 [Betaproteobacteria bacterium HGW-Betaproteobacteria-14]